MNRVLGFMRECGDDGVNYENYCIGVTDNDVTKVLYERHNLDETDRVVFDSVPSIDAASYLLDVFVTLGMHGKMVPLERRQDNSIVVYCYKTTPDTCQYDI